MARSAGQRPSKFVGVISDIVAFDFDMAVELRMSRFDDEREKNLLEYQATDIANKIGTMLFGKEKGAGKKDIREELVHS